MTSRPDVLGESVPIRPSKCLNFFFHCLEHLGCPEISSGIRRLVIFEVDAISYFVVKTRLQSSTLSQDSKVSKTTMLEY